MFYISYGETIVGLIEVKAKDNKIISINLVNKKDKLVKENEITRKCIKEIDEYFKGLRTSFDIPFLLIGTEFQKKVWKALMNVPYGKTASYKEVAKNIGHQKAVRAVGNAIGKNPCLIIIPCHRIINSNGHLGGFSSGLNIKKELLKLEGIIKKGNKI